MDLDLGGRRALVCGGSDGIGRASAVELASMGAEVILLARNADRLEAARRALPTPRGQAHGWLDVDVADTDALRARVAALAGESAVHILVNNTGGPPGGPAHAAVLDAFTDAFARHVLAAQVLVQALLPGMRDARWGRIVNVVSTSVREPIAGLGVSNTVRGAVAGWAKTLSRELAPHGITVNNVLPGYTETGRLTQIIGDRAAASSQDADRIAEAMRATVPAGRFAQPHEVAAAVAFLSSPAAAYINGVSLAVDGGRMQSI